MGNDLQTQLDAVKGAPLLYIGALLVVALIIWGIVDKLYRNRIDGLKEELDRERRENERLKSRPMPPAAPVSVPAATQERKSAKPPETKPPATLPTPENGNRTFVGPNITRKFFHDLYHDHTQHEANKLAAPYVGKWMRLSGTVYHVSNENRLGWKVGLKTDATLLVEATFLMFDEREAEKVEILRKGDAISAEGQIDHANNIWLQLKNCRII